MSAITMLSAFVNCNKANVTVDAPQKMNDVVQFTDLPQTFALSFCYDELNTEACFPVYLYAFKGKLVAWYDCELFQGYAREVELSGVA